MKIGMFSETYVPTPDGVANQIYNLKHAFEKKGHEVHVFTAGQRLCTLKENLSGDVHTFYSVSLPQYRLYRAPLFPYIGAKAITKKIKCDVIHAHTPFIMGISAYLSAKALSVPLIATYHTNAVDMSRELKGRLVSNPNAARVAWRLTDGLYARCDAVTVPTQIAKNYLIAHGVKKEPYVVWNGVAVDHFEKNKNSIDVRSTYGLGGGALIAYVGRISKDKCVDTLIRAMPFVLKCRDATLLVAGVGPEIDNLKALVRKLGVENNVKIIGYVEESHKPALLAQADIFVLPSKSDTFGVAMIEAMACETAVIASNAGGIPDVITDHENGLLFDVENHEDLAKKIMLLLDDAPLRKKIALRGKQDAKEKYSIEKCADRMLDIYREALEKKQRGIQ